LPEEADEGEVERSCDTLCIVTTLNKGLRNGGGIGDVLRQPSSQVRIEKTNFILFFS
jgi:inositol 1,4,5-triphosphate receptor type 1